LKTLPQVCKHETNQVHKCKKISHTIIATRKMFDQVMLQQLRIGNVHGLFYHEFLLHNFDEGCMQTYKNLAATSR
jgi:hypothetical protein